MNIDNYHVIKNSLQEGVQLIAVSKTKPVEDIKVLYDEGQRLFGENKAQEMKMKYEALPDDIEWHFIGHLQTNKIKYIAPFVKMIQSIDSYDLLEEVNRYAEKNHRVILCLLQFHIATEETKFGFSVDECIDMLKISPWQELHNIVIAGVMGMASFTENMEQVKKEFASLSSSFYRIKEQFFKDNASFKEISMGMSHDYQIALSEGSTMVRIGSSIFGERNYGKVNE